MSIKLDVGGSAYWSEIAQMNTLDNLLINKDINVVDYLERIPNGYISNQQQLIDTLRQRQSAMQQPQSGAQSPILDQNQPVNVPVGKGNGILQRALNQGTGIKLTKS